MEAIVCFFSLRGFGFLRPISHPAPDLYFHVSGIEGSADLQSGDVVSYELGQRNGKPIAVKVRLLERAAAAPSDAEGGSREK